MFGEVGADAAGDVEVQGSDRFAARRVGPAKTIGEGLLKVGRDRDEVVSNCVVFGGAYALPVVWTTAETRLAAAAMKMPTSTQT